MEGRYEIFFILMVEDLMQMRDFFHALLQKFGRLIRLKSVHRMMYGHKLNQKFLIPEKRGHEIIDLGLGRMQHDELDIRILSALSRDARLPLVRIGKEVGKDSRTVGYRIRRMKEKGMIVGYRAELDIKLIQRSMVQLNLQLSDLNIMPSIIEFFDTTETCLFAYEALGEYDLILELYIHDDQHLRSILSEFKQNYKDKYHSYDVTNVYRQEISTWSPYVR
jgi:DNA-binding Lrp family transcriptional regulator